MKSFVLSGMLSFLSILRFDLDEPLVDLIPHADHGSGNGRADADELSPTGSTSATVTADSLVGELVLSDGDAHLIIHESKAHRNF